LSDSGIILFDGTCAFCERSIRFIATRDRGYFRFGASQNPEGRALLERFGTSREGARSIILIEDGRLYLRSEASLRIAGRLGAPWNYARVFLWVPRPIRDVAYQCVAAIRTRIAGHSNACEVPPPEIRERLISIRASDAR
jgi:predicted DCC family thiol-disulfide oxidoreductase YuxK